MLKNKLSSKLPVPIVALASEGSSGVKCCIRLRFTPFADRKFSSDVHKALKDSAWRLCAGDLSRINACHKLLQLEKSPKTLTGLARTSWRQRHERVLLTSYFRDVLHSR